MPDKTREQDMDSAVLAAFLDGRLDGAARERVLSHLATSDVELAVLADAAAALAHVDAKRVDDTVGAKGFRLVRHRGFVVGLAAAAVLVGIGIWRFAITRPSSPGPTVIHLTAQLSPSTQPRSWSDDAWTVTRGSYDGGTERARAARIGALLVDIHVARSMADSSQVQLVSELARLLEAYPAGSVAAATARNLLTASAAQDDSSFAGVVAASTELASRDQLNIGAALEAARLAAGTHDTPFFLSGAASNAVSDASAHDSTGANARAEFMRLEAAAGRGSVDWAGAAERLTALLRAAVE
ncbi:MAG: hypothetical protein ACREND_08405 [Gemmatimonadaceae bacterium]